MTRTNESRNIFHDWLDHEILITKVRKLIFSTFGILEEIQKDNEE